MRAVYFLLLGTLLYSYRKALTRLRGEPFSLTPILGWMVGLGFFLVAPLTFIVLNGGYSIPSFYDANSLYGSVDLSGGTYFIPMLVIWLALMFSFQAIMILKRRPKTNIVKPELPINELKLKKIILLTFGLAILDYACTIWRLGGLESFLISHWYSRQEDLVTRLGDIYVLYLQVSLANQIVFTAVAALYTARQLQLRRLDLRFSVLIVFALLLQVVMSGNRIFAALYGLSVLASCWIYGRKKMIAALLIISPVVLLFFSAWAYFRHNLSTIVEDVPTYLEGDLGNRTTTTLLMNATEGTGVMILLHVVNDFGDKFNYLYGLTYTKAITFPLPRRLFPEKPQSFAALLAGLYEPGETTSLSATQFGELYANFGVLSVFLLPLVTVLILLLSEKLMQNIGKYSLLSAVLFLLLIWTARSSFEDNFIVFLFAVLLIKSLRFERGLCLQSAVLAAPIEYS